MTTTTYDPKPGIVTRWVRSLAAHFISVALSLAVAILIIVFMSVGAGLTVLWVGIPMLAGALIASHHFGRFKKSLALWQGATTWEDLTPLPSQGKPMRRFWSLVRSGDRWREVAYATIGAILDWILALIAIVMPAAGISEILSTFFPWVNGLTEVFQHLIFQSQAIYFWRPLSIVVGLIVFVLSIPLVRVFAHAQIGLTRAFLSPSRRSLEARLTGIEQAREAGVHAETDSLSRIERDLHDGPQQRLIRTGIDLASLERRLEEGDTVGARALIAEVRTRNDETISEIRGLARGFAPPVLADRGLKEAITSAAATSAIPASVSVELAGPRPPEAVERAVYYAVCEGLANAAKHSCATRVRVEVHQTPTDISATVTDNGTGGAVVVPTHGLAGLSERLTSVGGTLGIDSNDHGTTLRMTVPLG